MFNDRSLVQYGFVMEQPQPPHLYGVDRHDFDPVNMWGNQMFDKVLPEPFKSGEQGSCWRRSLLCAVTGQSPQAVRPWPFTSGVLCSMPVGSVVHNQQLACFSVGLTVLCLPHCFMLGGFCACCKYAWLCLACTSSKAQQHTEVMLILTAQLQVQVLATGKRLIG
jgi:hypothetical protein